MEKDFSLNLKSIKAFEQLSEKSINKIKEEGELVKYNFGQTICQDFILSNSINLIINGEARLLYKEDNK